MKAAPEMTPLVEAARSVIQADESVLVAYLFGSVAAGRSGPLSDIDIGHLDPRPARERAFLAAGKA